MSDIISPHKVASISSEETVSMSAPPGSDSLTDEEEESKESKRSEEPEETKEDKPLVSLPDETLSAALVIQRILVRELCPITLKPIKRPFRIYRAEAMQVYDPFALYEYITTRGEKLCPITRTAFTKCELLRLQRLTRTRLGSLKEVLIVYNADLQRNQTIDYLMDELASASTESAQIACISDIYGLIDDSERFAFLQRMRDMGIREHLLTVMLQVHRPPLPQMVDRAISPSEMEDDNDTYHFEDLFRSVMDDEENAGEV